LIEQGAKLSFGRHSPKSCLGSKLFRPVNLVAPFHLASQCFAAFACSLKIKKAAEPLPEKGVENHFRKEKKRNQESVYL
jgi:hypothetical protein